MEEVVFTSMKQTMLFVTVIAVLLENIAKVSYLKAFVKNIEI